MEWQATDQFGNLYVGESDATSVEALRPALASLVEEVRERAGDGFRVTVDFGYREVCGPDPENVTHVLRVPWLGEAPRPETLAEIAEAVAEACAALGVSGVTVESA